MREGGRWEGGRWEVREGGREGGREERSIRKRSSFFFLYSLQKKDAETVRQNCETLNNVLLAEFDYFSNMVVEDFQAMMINFLKQQADFHRQVLEAGQPLICV